MTAAASEAPEVDVHILGAFICERVPHNEWPNFSPPQAPILLSFVGSRAWRGLHYFLLGTYVHAFILRKQFAFQHSIASLQAAVRADAAEADVSEASKVVLASRACPCLHSHVIHHVALVLHDVQLSRALP
jgi:hypothetical protein